MVDLTAKVTSVKMYIGFEGVSMEAEVIFNSEPTKDDKKRISVDVNEEFHIKLHNQARRDKVTVSEVTRKLLEQYLSGKLRVAS